MPLRRYVYAQPHLNLLYPQTPPPWTFVEPPNMGKVANSDRDDDKACSSKRYKNPPSYPQQQLAVVVVIIMSYMDG